MLVVVDATPKSKKNINWAVLFLYSVFFFLFSFPVMMMMINTASAAAAAAEDDDCARVQVLVFLYFSSF